MTFLICVLSFLLLSERKGAISFSVYDISRSLTIPGWIVLIVLSLLLIFGTVRLISKIINKPNLK